MKALKYIALGFIAMTLILAGADLAISKPVPPQAPVTIQLSAEDAALCEAEGGCMVVTKDFMKSIAHEMARLRSLISKTCI